MAAPGRIAPSPLRSPPSEREGRAPAEPISFGERKARLAVSVRAKLALTVFATGLVTALLVIATVVFAFQRFENETAYRRGMTFLGKVVGMYDNIFDMHEKDAAAFQA